MEEPQEAAAVDTTEGVQASTAGANGTFNLEAAGVDAAEGDVGVLMPPSDAAETAPPATAEEAEPPAAAAEPQGGVLEEAEKAEDVPVEVEEDLEVPAEADRLPAAEQTLVPEVEDEVVPAAEAADAAAGAEQPVAEAVVTSSEQPAQAAEAPPSDADKKDADATAVVEAEDDAPAKDDDAALLERVASKQKAKPRRKGVRWDGRVNGLTLEEYREKKWGTQAGWSMVTRNGPKYSMRFQVRELNKSMPVFCTGDPTAAKMKLLRSSPSWTMNQAFSFKDQEKSPGPSEYSFKTSLGPNRHPTIAKHTGVAFGLPDPTKEIKPSPGPGENHTYLMEKWSKFPTPPRVMIQGRESWAKTKAEQLGPGVGQYKLDNMTRVGKISVLGCVTIPEGLRASLGGALGDVPIGEQGLSSPAPGDYNVPGMVKCRNHHVNQKKPPGWSLPREPRGLLE